VDEDDDDEEDDEDDGDHENDEQALVLEKEGSRGPETEAPGRQWCRSRESAELGMILNSTSVPAWHLSREDKNGVVVRMSSSIVALVSQVAHSLVHAPLCLLTDLRGFFVAFSDRRAFLVRGDEG
jgi:hypothetical protein